MARIQITDLPFLQDLTEEQLKELFGAGAKSYKPSFDSLEERNLMSAFSSVLTAVQAPAFSAATFQTIAPVRINLHQPIQVISQEPVAPVASTLNQPIQMSPASPLAPQTHAGPYTNDASALVPAISNHFAKNLSSDTVQLDSKYNVANFDPTVDYLGGIGANKEGTIGYDGVPILNSNPGAPVSLFLNFTGNRMSSHFFYDTNDGTPLNGRDLKAFHHVFDLDGDPTSFNAEEQQAMTQIWKYVADAYAPFNVNVTTHSDYPDINSEGYSDTIGYRAYEGHTLEVAIGGRSPLPLIDGLPAYGTSHVGSFFNHSAHTVFVFSDTIRSDASDYLPELVAHTAEHEAGHAFGLEHQSDYQIRSFGGRVVANTDVPLDDYNPGTADWAPIMGSASIQRSTWYNGRSAKLGGAYQDDLRVLAEGGTNSHNSTPGLGYRAQPVSSQYWQPMPEEQPEQYHSSGFIGAFDAATGGPDVQWYGFESKGGPVFVQLTGAGRKGILHSALQLWTSDTFTLLAASAVEEPTNSLGATWLPAGRYFVQVSSTGGYGNMGTYNLYVSAPHAGDVHPIGSETGNLSGLQSATGLSAQAAVLESSPTRFLNYAPIGTTTASLTVDPNLSLPTTPYLTATDTASPASVSAIEDLTAASFTLTSPDGTTHQLAIQTQTGQADGSASFSGVWDPQNADGGATATGTLAQDAAGNIHIAFSLSDGSSVDGTISGQPGTHHLDAMMTPADGGSPSQIAGDQDQAIPAGIPGPVLLDQTLGAFAADAGNLPSSLVDTASLPADSGNVPLLSADFGTLPDDLVAAGVETQAADPSAMALSLADSGLVAAPSTPLPADSATFATDEVAPVLLPADPGFAAQAQPATGEVRLDQPV